MSRITLPVLQAFLAAKNGPVLIVLWVEKMQVGSGLGNLRKNRVRSVRVESGNVNKELFYFLLPALFNADKSAN